MPGSPKVDLGEGFIRSHELLHALQSDIASAYQALEIDRASQYLRRCVVRAIFSFIEAAVECVKVEIRSTVRIDYPECDLTEKEKETLGALHVIGSRDDKFFPLDQNIKKNISVGRKSLEYTVVQIEYFDGRISGFSACQSSSQSPHSSKNFL